MCNSTMCNTVITGRDHLTVLSFRGIHIKISSFVSQQNGKTFVNCKTNESQIRKELLAAYMHTCRCNTEKAALHKRMNMAQSRGKTSCTKHKHTVTHSNTAGDY